MASILDQYMQASAGENLNPFLGPDVTEPISTGYVEVKSEDDVPIFRRQKINFRPPSNIVDVVVCNNMVAIALSNNVLMRLDLTNPSEIDSVDITKRMDDSVHRIFMDPTARHLIVCMKSQESFYLARNSKKPKPLAKMKGHLINAIAWNKSKLTESSTQTILLGTTKGLVFETELEPEEKFFQGGLEKFWKQLYNVNSSGGPEEPIYGIMFEKFPVSPKSDRKYFVMVSTLSRLYQFIGDVTVTDSLDLQPLFAEYESNPAPFLEMPGHLDSSELALFYPKIRGLPNSFAWLTGSGVYFGKLDFGPPESWDNITAETRLLQYGFEEGKETTPPLSIGLTGFHALMLHKDKFQAVSLLSEQVVFEDQFPPRYGAMRGLFIDTVKKTLWIFSDSAIFQYHVTRESRDVWKMYLERGEFELAKEYCRDNPANLDKVLTKQAEELFESKSYANAARCYAQTQVSFEEVALKFIQVEESQALRMFLLKKLDSMKHQDKTQMTMLIMWLIELYLNDLGGLKEENAKLKYEGLQEEFRKFLAQTKVKTCLDQNRKTAYDLISSHGDVENLIFFAMFMQDFEHVISHHIQHDDFMAALDVLTKQTDTELYYKFSPVLMQHIPRQTVNAWTEQKKKKLDPRRLIPALVHYHQQGKSTQTEEAIRYLEFCIERLGNRDQAIHNYLLSLYIEQEDDESLLRYLQMQGQDPEEVCYDMKYALRLCSEHDKQKACVHIYSTMGLFEEAVDLSLKVDVDLAKIQAQKPPEDDEVLRKKLWLRIARHVVEEEGDVKKAMEFLNQSELLKIEDILPFFQDFVTIDHFKDAICSSLHEYNQHIEELKSEMQEATESAKTIRGDIHEMRNKYRVVPAQEKCSICLYPLLTRGFYVFPCHHSFHSDCLKNEILPHLKEKQRAKVQDLFNQLYATSRTDSSSVSSTSRETLKNELDELIASECPFCGEIMIRSVDQPFISPDEYESVLESWQ
ncbi:vacuolar protein sorting-associated protein 18 homolog [Pocillopora damicornis]|uniref:vacuolar protein sorting-associated protein 18 homolog n=1 Tax=Pocillopora damicornis TaxID=46731 RepID=UPI000F557B07|nr:vacuolar protein sorting-associated protein 18 homolog [Pocillopora damicornis]